MQKLFRLAIAALVLSSASAALSQQQAPPTRTEQILSHFDVALGGIGVFTGGVSGTTPNTGPNPNTTVANTASNTFGAIFQVRAQKSPYVGIEGNITYHRFTETYNCCNLQGGAQTNAEEFSLGYIVRPPHEFYGAKPYASVGAGSIKFQPTTFGGLGFRTQARASYYYHVGVDIPVLGDNFALRLGFRQALYLVPDFGQNYITIKKRTLTSEPVFAFVYHF